MNGTLFAGLDVDVDVDDADREGGFRCILADPPWEERGGGKRGADCHYPLLSTPDVIRVMSTAPVWRPAASCHLWLWVTDNFLRDGLLVLDALGFSYRRTLAWTKVSDGGRLQVGLGQYLRGSHELCLLGVRGRPMVPRPGRRRPSAVLAPRTRHSAKPEEAYQTIESVSPGPRAEIFARGRRPGWTTWGNDESLEDEQ